MLEVAPSTYYAAKARPTSVGRLRDEELKVEIARVHAENFGVYGIEKVWRQLNREGVGVGRDRVARLMRDLNLEGVVRGRYHSIVRGRRPIILSSSSHSPTRASKVVWLVVASGLTPIRRRLLPVIVDRDARRHGRAGPAAGGAQSQTCPPRARWRDPNGFRKPQQFWAFFRHLSTSSASSCHLVSQVPETTETGPQSRFQVQISRGGLLKKPWRGWMGIERTWDGSAPPHRRF